MTYKLQFSQYNERTILVEWPAIIDAKLLEDVLDFKYKVEKKYIKQNIEVVSAYSSILIIYESTIDNINDVFFILKRLYLSPLIKTYDNSKLIDIPVCYEGGFASDLEAYSVAINLSKPEIIKLHSEVVYTVYFIGFLPGFLYLGGLHSALHLNRKTTPNLNVKKGSVGIGGNQTGIYPQDSPGGWHVIGNSPIELFNPNRNPPCDFNAGDKVKFHSISKHEYIKIQNERKNSRDKDSLIL